MSGRRADKQGVMTFTDHVCAVCESDCDRVTYLLRRNRELEHQNFALAYALVEAKNFRAFVRDEIEARYPKENTP